MKSNDISGIPLDGEEDYTSRGDVNRLRLFRRPRLSNNPKTRRLQFMKTRYTRPKCGMCGRLAHYSRTYPKREFYCKRDLPTKLREKLSLEYQWLHYIMPLSNYLDGNR